jgi:ABC-2 type transport system ATP-binding protein
MIAASPETPMVRLDRMTRRFGDLVAVDSLSFEVRRGEMFGLIGPDGAGKTTTLRVILGLLRAGEGAVATCGLDPAARRKELARKVGYLSQRFTLYGDLSVDENVSFFAEIYDVPDWRPRRDDLLQWLRLAPFRNRLADRLSGGMKQKLALACTLIHTPELLVLDEPTTGVDPVSRREFWRALARLQREGMTILVTTPYLDEAERCQRIALMDHGHLLDLDTPDALRRGVNRSIVEIIARPKRAVLESLRKSPEVAEVETFGERLHVTLRAAGSEAETARAAERLSGGLRSGGMEVDSCRVIPPSLEDVFIARTRSGEPERNAEALS